MRGSIRNPKSILPKLKSHSLANSFRTLQPPPPDQHTAITTQISKLLTTKSPTAATWQTLTAIFSSQPESEPEREPEPESEPERRHLVERTLLHLQHPADADQALSFFRWSSQPPNPPHPLRSRCLLIHILLRTHRPLRALSLLTPLLPDPSLPDTLLATYPLVPSGPHTFDLLIRSYARRGMLDPAFCALRILTDRGHSPGVATANSVLHLASKSDGDAPSAWNVYEYMLEKRIYPNETTVKIMTALMCREGSLRETLRVLRTMYGKNCGPAVVVNLRLVFRVFEEGRIDDGVLLMKRLLQKNLMLDCVVNSMVVYGHCKMGRLDSAHGLYTDMVKRGYSPNAFVYTSFIGAHCKEGRIEEAVRLVEEMVCVGLKPYDDTYSYLIEGGSKFGSLEIGLGFYEKMLKERFLPSCVACNEILGRLCEEGYAKKANEMLSVLIDKGFVPNKDTYLKLIDGFGKTGNAQEILKLKYEMEHKGL